MPFSLSLKLNSQLFPSLIIVSGQFVVICREIRERELFTVVDHPPERDGLLTFPLFFSKWSDSK
jgi:hypothetical protein